ncbi:MAG: adenosylcobalamin-dependent ribonucleoside-diphosphate reductase [Candidatus Omnitrophica bacterium]|nr:adenosylcobalamin-dependent ribonucleoside-diphosphate reductase [Candidatus Omnitrophota bacterium]
MRKIILPKQIRKRSAAKAGPGPKDDLKLPLNTLEVLQRRYLIRDDAGRIIETPNELFRRVASHIAQAESGFRSRLPREEAEEIFYRMMRNLEFIPNSPTLMNAGTKLGQLSACFVLPVEDSIGGIFETLKAMARIHQSGGGVGYTFSHLRPKGDLVDSTKGEASGPVSFMEIFDKATAVIVQGGRRRGANMGILRCDHPDVLEFIEAKSEEGAFANFNLSLGVTDAFMEAVRKNKKFSLVNPRTGMAVKEVKARSIFDLAVNAAWRTGDPGLIFLDEINRHNPTPALGEIEATNPCGELPLLAYESCNLASLNLGKMARGGRMDWMKLKDYLHWGVRFLDDVIEVNRYPLPQIREISFANRKIGLGVMGFADLLIMLGIPYDSGKAVTFARSLMHFIRKESLDASEELARERGVFPNFKKSVYSLQRRPMRNATVNTIAPTGTISIIAGCSSGIEPLFGISFVRNVLSGTQLFETNPLFEDAARKRGIYRKELLTAIARRGSLRGIAGVPAELAKIFVTAFDVASLQHLKIQGAFQAYTDNSVSKTINLPADATVDMVREIYLASHTMRCKGITIYRYGSKAHQVLSFGEGDSRAQGALLGADAEYSGGCAQKECLF